MLTINNYKFYNSAKKLHKLISYNNNTIAVVYSHVQAIASSLPSSGLKYPESHGHTAVAVATPLVLLNMGHG